MKQKLNKYLFRVSAHLPKSEEEYFDLSLIMTLLMFLYVINDIPLYSVIIPLFSFSGILFKSIRQSILFWVLMLMYLSYFYVISGTSVYVPNHKYLYAFFNLIIVISLYAKKKTSDWFEIYKISAQYMIGFVFLLATIGKFLAPEFLNGSFFEFTLLTDPRFFGFTSLVGNIDDASLFIGLDEFSNMQSSNDINAVVQLQSPTNLQSLGLFLSYWTIFIEASIAITFLVKYNTFIGKYRNWVLLVFIITTYPIATVYGFAILLILLALITVSNVNNKITWQILFIIIFILVPLMRFPFFSLLKMLM